VPHEKDRVNGNSFISLFILLGSYCFKWHCQERRYRWFTPEYLYLPGWACTQ